MAGGLMNIASYASQDLYLTGAPQITFFKMVYRRYTNFSMESIFLDFNDNIKFGYDTELTPPRIGDLIHKAYLHVNIPAISVSRQDVGIDLSNSDFMKSDNQQFIHYEKIRTIYMNVMTTIYRIIFKAYNASNVSYSGLVQDVTDYVRSNNVTQILNEYERLLDSTKKNLQKIKSRTNENINTNFNFLDSKKSNLWYILTHTNVNNLFDTATHLLDVQQFDPNSPEYAKELQQIMKKTILKEAEKGIDFCKQVQKYYFDIYKAYVNKTTNDKNNNIKCAWVKNLGHSLIEYIDVYIGGKRIDRHLGIWINIWYQLTYKEDQIMIYNKIIGNVEELTFFDKKEKPSYDIYVPLTFWFCKFNGLSFPLIAMQYNDIRINVKLRKFAEVFYIERIYKAQYNGNDVFLTAELIELMQNSNQNLINIEQEHDIDLNDLWENKGKQLHGHILMDYIYLESAERKKFAQSGHEYLIERIQDEKFDKVQQTDFDVELNFTNPSKELIWVLLKDIYTNNDSGYNECRWNDYSLNRDNKNPILSAQLSFNNYTRIQKQVGIYFDTYQPLTYHHVTPSAGINMYSFCLDPTKQQPTGSCNFSKLTNVRLFLNINNTYLRYTDPQIYDHDQNINFDINIIEPHILLDKIDIDYAKRVLNTYKNTATLENITSGNIKKLLDEAQTTVNIYDQLSTGKSIQINTISYKKIIFSTMTNLFVFNLSMNILRLIGGYGALAFTSNN